MSNTILNTEVSLIENNLKDGNVIVKTTDGNIYCADHVIVTIPLGVLKAKYNTLFNPPLPEIKIKTIQVCPFPWKTCQWEHSTSSSALKVDDRKTTK